jgi:hypothetical protein
MRKMITASVCAASAALALLLPSAGASASVAARCHLRHLAVSVRAGGAAAGSAYYRLRFRNTGARACSLTGYPGVSFVTSPAGPRIGLAAGRDASYPVRAVVLEPGQRAVARLQVLDARDYPRRTCHPVRARWLLVYPPGAWGAFVLPFDALACAKPVPVLFVTAVR